MKKIRSAALAIACIAASACGHVCAQEFELKGLRIGMTEAEFMLLNPQALCEDRSLQTGPKSDIPAKRSCNVPGFTVASKEAIEASFFFYGDKLGGLVVTISRAHMVDVGNALIEKYGAFRSDIQRGIAEWAFGTTSMTLARNGDISLLSVRSAVSDSWEQKARSVKARRDAADL